MKTIFHLQNLATNEHKYYKALSNLYSENLEKPRRRIFMRSSSGLFDKLLARWTLNHHDWKQPYEVSIAGKNHDMSKPTHLIFRGELIRSEASIKHGKKIHHQLRRSKKAVS